VDTVQWRTHFSTGVLVRMLVLAVLGIGLGLWKADFIDQVYFRQQLTVTGLVINGGILALFLAGLVKTALGFLFYAREERALARFIHNLEGEETQPIAGVPGDSLIHRRYRTLELLHAHRTPIDHSALAAALVAAESTRNSLPRFVNNVLILTGVFGTIVSLSIALIGASDLLASALDSGGMGLVIHGMSTALSTTITAIVCFLYFGYFHLKLNDAQTNLLSALEQVTSQYLLPRFQVRTENVLYEFTGLVRALQRLTDRLSTAQAGLEGQQQRLVEALEEYRGQARITNAELSALQQTLRIGFRLPPEDA